MANKNTSHGHCPASGPSPTYQSWQMMKDRCTNLKRMGPTHALYKNRGITVCDRWLQSFDNFLADMGERPAGTSLDRFPDNQGNYEPGNCRWATQKQQMRNTSRNLVVEFKGEKRALIEWCEILGLNYKAVRARIGQYGWDPIVALTTPVLPQPNERTHCLAGHPFDEKNTRTMPNGRRMCRACDRRRAAVRREAMAHDLARAEAAIKLLS